MDTQPKAHLWWGRIQSEADARRIVLSLGWIGLAWSFALSVPVFIGSRHNPRFAADPFIIFGLYAAATVLVIAWKSRVAAAFELAMTMLAGGVEVWLVAGHLGKTAYEIAVSINLALTVVALAAGCRTFWACVRWRRIRATGGDSSHLATAFD